LYTNERFVQYYLYLNTNAAGFTSNQTNKVLQMMNAEPVNGTMNIVIGGNHDGPTGAGLTAKTSLVNQGASVMTNP
jgi:DNA repair exonuclease SbcCD nuclease subunit